MTRGGADTAERQHLHASGRVSFLQLLILPTLDRNDISFLSNSHQRWALKLPLHLLVPPPLHSQATERVERGPAGRSRGTWDAGAGVGNVECGDVKCWPDRGPRPHHTTSPLHKSTNVAAEGLFPGRALLSSQGGVLQSCRGSGRVQGPRSRKVSDLRAEQGLRGKIPQP